MQLKQYQEDALSVWAGSLRSLLLPTERRIQTIRYESELAGTAGRSRKVRRRTRGPAEVSMYACD